MKTLTGLEAVQPETRDDSAVRNLVRRCRAGEPEAFDEVVTRYHECVARVAARLLGHRHDTDDVVQDVFLRVLEKLDTFRADSRFSTWLIAITVNCCRSHKRREALRSRMLWGLWSRRTHAEEPRRTERSSNMIARVQDAVGRMPATYREPIVLRYLEELSVGEIAEILNISTTAVEARLSRGRQRLKSVLMIRKEH